MAIVKEVTDAFGITDSDEELRQARMDSELFGRGGLDVTSRNFAPTGYSPGQYGVADYGKGTPYENSGFYSVHNGVTGQRDPRNYQYGRDPNYAANQSQESLNRGNSNQAVLQNFGNQANAFGREQGAQQAAYGHQSARGVQNFAPTATAYGNSGAAYGEQAGRRDAPELDFKNQNYSIGQARGDASMLKGLELQEGPSAAQAQLQSGLNQAQAANTSMARGGRGWGGGASALRGAMAQNASMGQNAALQSTQLRANENAAWRGRQASNLGTSATVNAGLAQQYGNQATSAAENQLRSRQTNDAAVQAGYQTGITGARTGADIYGAGAQLGATGLRDQANATGAGIETGARLQEAGMKQGWAGEAGRTAAMDRQYSGDQAYEGMLTQEAGIRQGIAVDANQAAAAENAASTAAVGSVLTAGANWATEDDDKKSSDERNKVKLSSEAYGNPYGRRGAPGHVASDRKSETVPDFRSVPDYTYAYKNPSAPGAEGGVHVGPMAQDLERVLPGVVDETPHGKTVDSGRLALATTGAVGDMQRRIAELEAMRTREARGG